MGANSAFLTLLKCGFVFSLCAILMAREIFALPANPSEMNSTPQANEVSPVRIRVRLSASVPDVSVRGMDLKLYEAFAFGNEADGRQLFKSVLFRRGRSNWTFRCSQSGIQLASESSDVVSGILNSKVLKSPVLIKSPAGFFTLSGSPYREELRIHSNGSKCEIVNVLDMEKYLDGVVNAEFSSKWGKEAVGAQVVAARTYALFQMYSARQRKNSHFDVESTVKDQVYAGIALEDPEASRVVQSTRGLVLFASDETNVPIKAFYHSACGGRTEVPEHVWGRNYPGFKGGVDCPFCRETFKHRWTYELETERLIGFLRAGAINEGIPRDWPVEWREILSRFSPVTLVPVNRDDSGRILKLDTIWQDNSGNIRKLSLEGAAFRNWIGPIRIRSTAFDVRPSGKGGFIFTGRGNGHGVGMCQWGARYMGNHGYKTAEILKHYYPETVLRKIW